MNKKRLWNVFRAACYSGLLECRKCPLEKKSLKTCKKIRDDYKFFRKWLEQEMGR